MSLHNIAKGTPFEKISEMLALGEAKGTMMYYALARLAKEQGNDDVAAEFIEAANQEAIHAGFYATLVGMYPQDFWNIVRGAMAAEVAFAIRLRIPRKLWQLLMRVNSVVLTVIGFRFWKNPNGLSILA